MEITNELIRIFANWTKLKIRLHAGEKIKFPKEKQIWWASLGQNIGVEINGRNERFERPVLVVKKYNREAMLILPISSKQKEGNPYFSFVDNEGRNNIAVLSQLKSISVKRFIRKMGKINNKEFVEIKEKLKDFV